VIGELRASGRPAEAWPSRLPVGGHAWPGVVEDELFGGLVDDGGAG